MGAFYKTNNMNPINKTIGTYNSNVFLETGEFMNNVYNPYQGRTAVTFTHGQTFMFEVKSDDEAKPNKKLWRSIEDEWKPSRDE